MRVELTEQGLIRHRLALWASQSDATGRKLGEALRDHSWSGLARRGRQ